MQLFCAADGQQDVFYDVYGLDATYLGRFRPSLLQIQYALPFTFVGRVEPPTGAPEEQEIVLTMATGREVRLPRNRNGLGAQWKPDDPYQKFRCLIVHLLPPREGMMDKPVVWIYRAEEVSVATLLVRPRAFDDNESIGDLVLASQGAIRNRLLKPLELV